MLENWIFDIGLFCGILLFLFTVDGSVGRIIYRIWAGNKPHEVCPTCYGNKKMECNDGEHRRCWHCKGRGWIVEKRNELPERESIELPKSVEPQKSQEDNGDLFKRI